MLPSSPLARRLSLQSVLFATGEGAFVTGSAVFFTQIVGLAAAQVGLGMTIAGLTSFLVAIPLGKAADRFGAQRAWAVGAAAEALVYFVWPWLGGFAAYLTMMVVLQLIDVFAGSGRGAYALDVFPREERVNAQAFIRAALNIGFTVGALIGGLALALDSERVIQLVPLLTGTILLLNTFFILRLPRAPRHHPATDVSAEEHLVSPGALRNRGFLGLMVGDGVLGTNQVLLNVVIPLWLVQETDAPHVLLAWLFGTNTVMAVFLQVAAARGVDSVASALRAARLSAGFMVVSCLIVLVTHDTVGWVTIALVWLGHVTVTGAELYQSAGHWGLMSELSDPTRRGEYQSAAHLGGTVGHVWAPAVYTYLAMQWGTPGWLLIAGLVALATASMPASARSAERYLARHSLGEPGPASPPTAG